MNASFKKLLSLLLSAFILISCAKEKDGFIGPDEQYKSCLLTLAHTTMHTANAGSFAWQFWDTISYNARGQVANYNILDNSSELNSGSYFAVEYNAFGKISKINSAKTLEEPWYKTFEYNAAGLLIKNNTFQVVVPGDSPVFNGFELYNYNAANKLIRKSRYNASNTLEGYVQYSYPAANSGRREVFRIISGLPVTDYWEEYTFDDKHNPYHNLGVFHDEVLLSAHNPLTVKFFSSYSGKTDSSYYKYTYNTAGFPTTVKTFSYQNPSPGRETVFNYRCR